MVRIADITDSKRFRKFQGASGNDLFVVSQGNYSKPLALMEAHNYD
jgi:hypothetical protein